jgi:hypothetical protein
MTAGRFTKGQSGNPKGRPRKARAASTASAFDVIIDRTLTITRDGTVRELTIEEALQHKTYQEALAGSRMARRQILKMIAKREQAIADRQPAPQVKYTWKTEQCDPDNADEALLLLGIATEDVREGDPRRRLLLEPWAVQAALSRNRALSLSQRAVDSIRRSTRDPDEVRGLIANER